MANISTGVPVRPHSAVSQFTDRKSATPKSQESSWVDFFCPGRQELAPGNGENLPLRGLKILIDPGHGGSDPGAPGPGGGRETDVNLGVSQKLRSKLQVLGAEVRMTRTTDSNVGESGGKQQDELKARVAIAKELVAVGMVDQNILAAGPRN